MRRALALPLPPRASIPSYDVAHLRRPIRRTALVRWLLAAALAGTLGATVAVAFGSTAAPAAFVSPGSSAVVVLDLSRSVDPTEYRIVRSTLEQLVATNTPTGFIAFSDTAYELLPPGSKAAAVQPMIRLFTPRPGVRVDPGSLGAYPASPWGEDFRGGTRISTGLVLARQVLARDHVRNGDVILISDLETAPSDTPTLASELVRYRLEHVRLSVVALSPTAEARALFERVMGARAFVAPTDVFTAGRRVRARTIGRGAAPWLIALAGVVLLLLGANEWLCRRVEVPRP